jgi:hypothetical protein
MSFKQLADKTFA